MNFFKLLCKLIQSFKILHLILNLNYFIARIYDYKKRSFKTLLKNEKKFVFYKNFVKINKIL